MERIWDWDWDPINYRHIRKSVIELLVCIVGSVDVQPRHILTHDNSVGFNP
jgi:hypothetical protein